MPSSKVVVDEAHSQFARPDGSEPPRYTVPAGKSIELDTSGYSFPAKSDYGVGGPNLISLFMGENRKYRLRWKNGVSTYTLSADTLQPEVGSVPFSGFHSGEAFILVVAFEDSRESTPKAVSIKMLWGCMGVVQ